LLPLRVDKLDAYCNKELQGFATRYCIGWDFAIASFIDSKCSKVNDLRKAELEIQLKLIGKELADAKNPLILSGVQTGNEDIINASANIAAALSCQQEKWQT